MILSQKLTAALTVVVTGLVLAGCGNSSASPDNATPDKSRTPIIVEVVEVRPAPFSDIIQVAGTIKAMEEALLSPEEGGVVKTWHVEKGQYVRKGELIVSLNDDVARASYDAAHAQYQIAELNYARQLKVFEEKGISELQLRNLEYTRDAAKAQADLMKARLERMHLRSPIDGILNDRLIETGEFAPPARPIAHVVNTVRLKVLADIPERYAASVGLGGLASVTVDAIPGDTLSGRIAFVGAAISTSNRALPTEIHLSNPGRKLKPEMIARTTIVLSLQRDAILLSENLIQQVDRNKLIVYVANNGHAEERIVKLGSRRGNLVEVVDGLKEGDLVITAGYQKLVHGQAIHVAG